VLHNEAHRKLIGLEAPLIQTEFADFVRQYGDLEAWMMES